MQKTLTTDGVRTTVKTIATTDPNSIMSKSTISGSTLRRLARECCDPDTTEELDEVLAQKKGVRGHNPSLKRLRSIARRCTDPDTVDQMDRRLYRSH